MVGFRQTFLNLSSDQGGNGSGSMCDESMCDDDVASSFILVRISLFVTM